MAFIDFIKEAGISVAQLVWPAIVANMGMWFTSSAADGSISVYEWRKGAETLITCVVGGFLLWLTLKLGWNVDVNPAAASLGIGFVNWLWSLFSKLSLKHQAKLSQLKAQS